MIRPTHWLVRSSFWPTLFGVDKLISDAQNRFHHFASFGPILTGTTTIDPCMLGERHLPSGVNAVTFIADRAAWLEPSSSTRIEQKRARPQGCVKHDSHRVDGYLTKCRWRDDELASSSSKNRAAKKFIMTAGAVHLSIARLQPFGAGRDKSISSDSTCVDMRPRLFLPSALYPTILAGSYRLARREGKSQPDSLT